MEKITCNKCFIEKENINFDKKKSAKTGHAYSCKECMKEYNKNRYFTKRSDLLSQCKNYRDNNKIKERIRSNNYYKNNDVNIKRLERRKNDNLYRIKTGIRSMLVSILRKNGYKKTSKSNEILGCSYEEFKQHLESKFEDWMRWDNYGKPKDGIYELNKTWDIDHIIPVSSAITEEDILKLNHFSNLQPLCSYTNRFIKRDIFN